MHSDDWDICGKKGGVRSGYQQDADVHAREGQARTMRALAWAERAREMLEQALPFIPNYGNPAHKVDVREGMQDRFRALLDEWPGEKKEIEVPPACSRCIYFGGISECRRRAPVVGEYTKAVWPSVSPHDGWCGEFEIDLSK